MKTERIAYIAVITAFFVYTLYSCEQGKNQKLLMQLENSQLRQKVRELEAIRDTAEAKAAHEESARIKIQLIAQTEQSDLRAQISILKKRILPAGKLASVEPTPSDSGVAAKFCDCGTRDSIIEKLDLLVISLDREKNDLISSYSKELKFRADELIAVKEISGVWEKAAVAGNRKLRKAERRKRFWKGTAIVLTGGILGLILSQ